MNGRKLKQLFAAARNDPSPPPPAGFEADVLFAIRREARGELPGEGAFFDQLILWFPRLAWGAAAIIALSVAVDLGMTAAGLPDLSDGLAQISTQWFLTPNGL